MILENKYILLIAFLFMGFGLFGQSQISGDLLTLSELTISKSPTIQRNSLVIDQATANIQTQRSVFDYQLSSSLSSRRTEQTLFDADPRNQILGTDFISRNTGISLAVQKQFRTGLIANISTDYSRAATNFPFNDFGEEVGPNLSDLVSSATFSLTQPLLRNNGFKVITAFERAAKLELKSTEENFELNTAFELQQLGAAYWQYLATYESLSIFQENEARVRRVLEITNELVKADKRPASELFQIKADLANQERQTNLAEQNFYNAKLAMGGIIGLSETDSKTIEKPLDVFPKLSRDFIERDDHLEALTTLAISNRTDINATEYSIEGLKAQLHAAKNATLPQLDISAFYTVGGAAIGGGLENYFNAFGNRQGRNNVRGIGLNFTFPLNNNSAKANLALNKIAISDQEIALANLKRTISINVSIAHNNLIRSVAVVEKAEEYLANSKEVFNNEQVRFQNGLTTLLNLILFQERLTFAQLEVVNARQQLAVAITNLRFETGTIITKGANNSFLINKDNFYTLPKL